MNEASDLINWLWRIPPQVIILERLLLYRLVE